MTALLSTVASSIKGSWTVILKEISNSIWGSCWEKSQVHYLLTPGASSLLSSFHSVTHSAGPHPQIPWLSSGLRVSLDRNLTLGSPQSELLFALWIQMQLPEVQDIVTFDLLCARSHGGVWRLRHCGNQVEVSRTLLPTTWHIPS